MTQGDDKTIGEIGRSVERIEKQLEIMREDVRVRYHDLADKMTVAVGPVSVHSVMLANQQQNLDRHEDSLASLTTKVEDISANANRIAGAGAVLAFVSSLIPWPWRH